MVSRFGTVTNWHGFPEPTVLLQDVVFVNSGQQATDHVWFKVGQMWRGVKEGDTVEFDARIASYTKGYVNHREGVDDRTFDYKLNRPTKIEVMHQ